ncbi:MAG: CPBP family intramembrane metalloprotease [Chloroflexi bacterium]|nr:CPBP family intramembrane metalloprotease [Chloroflexota bacterium]
MSHGSDTVPKTRLSGLLTEKPRLRYAAITIGAVLTWICLDVWLSRIFREYPVGFQNQDPTLPSFVFGCLFVAAAIGISIFLARTAATRYLVIYVAAGSVFLGFAILFATLSDRVETQTAIRSAAAAIVGSAALIATAVSYASSTSKPLLEQLRLYLPGQRKFIAFGLPLAAWVAIAIAWQFTPFNPVAHPNAPDPIIGLNSAFDNNVFATIIYVAILVPIVEELFFRGMIITFLANATHPAIAVLISALVFALFHIDPSYFSINQVIYIFCLGTVFGTAAVITKSIWPGVLMHALNNALVTLQSIPFPT